MDSPSITSLFHFMKDQLDPSLSMEQSDGFIRFFCPGLPFDLYIIQRLGVDVHEIDSKRRIIISEQQLGLQLPKIKNRIKALSGKAVKIYARETVLARIDKKQALAFQEEHHLQIVLPGKYRYGLFYQGELVSVAVFSGGRKMRDYAEEYRSFELLRFCHKSDHIVIGGLSKLIKAFKKDFNPDDIMTYVDMDWAQDSSLKAIGFEERGMRKGETFWVSEGIQYIIGKEEELLEIADNHPNGYLYRNLGSIKLVMSL